MQRLDYAALRKSCRIPILTVYNSPKDFPGRFVIRLFDVDQPTMLYFVADTLEGVRAVVPHEMRRLARHPDDDPCIVEVYV